MKKIISILLIITLLLLFIKPAKFNTLKDSDIIYSSKNKEYIEKDNYLSYKDYIELIKNLYIVYEFEENDMNKPDISQWILSIETIPQVELPDKGGFTNKLPWFQNQLGSCGAMSTSRALSRIFGFPVSTLWVYINAKIIEDSFETEGLAFESLVYVACEIGVIPESMLQYNDEIEWSNKQVLQNMLTDEMFETAKDYKIKGVVKLNNSTEIKQSLANKYPVIWGATISEDFRFDEDGYVLLFGVVVGGHAMNMSNFDSSLTYIFSETNQVHTGFVNIDQTWKINDRLWGDDGIGHISYKSLDDEIIVIPGYPGFKLWNECYGLIPFNEDYQKMLLPKKTVELFIDKKEYKVDGITKISDVAPYIKDGRTMIPLRVLSEGLGFTIGWNGDTREITIGDQFGDIKLKVDSKEIYMKSVVQELDWIKSETEMDVPVEIMYDRSFVPVRFVAEKLSSQVEWNPDTRSVVIKYY